MRIKIAILSILLLIGSLSFAQRGESQPVRFEKISDNLFEILDGSGARGGAYIGDSEVLLIDSKMNKESVEQTLKELKKITDFPVKYLVNTHSDGDHVNGNQYFSKDVIFISHKNCRDDFFLPGRSGSASMWLDPALSQFVPSVTFTHRLDLYLGSKKVELWYFGEGHTTGDVVVYFPVEKIAFIGDQIFLERVQLIHKHKNGNSFEHVKTLTNMIKTLPAEYFYSGHSERADKSVISKQIKEMQARQNKIRTLIKGGKKLEVIQAEFSKEEKTLVGAIYNEITKEGY